MNWLQEWLSPALIEALGWTLLHSLWQSLILLVGLLVTFRLFKKLSAATKYLMMIGALVVLVSWSAGTLTKYWPPAVESSQQALHAPIVVDAQTPLLILTGVAEENVWQDQVTAYLKYWFPLLVGLWLLGIVLFSLRLVGGFWYLQRLKNLQNHPVSVHWQEQFKSLAHKIGVKKSITLLESALVEVPMVIGHLKPVVLLPAGIFSGLPPAYLEAVLAHELAHVKRYDFVVNVLQALAETLFFFNPMVWKLSSMIRETREHACDDLAVKVTGKPLEYAKALTELEESRQSAYAGGLVLAFGGKQHQLMTRVKRLFGSGSYKAGWVEKTMALLLLVSSLLSFTWYKQGQAKTQMELEQPLPVLEEEVNVVEGHVNKLTALVANTRGPIVDFMPVDGDSTKQDSLKAMKTIKLRKSIYIHRNTPIDTILAPYTRIIVSEGDTTIVVGDSLPYDIVVLPELKSYEFDMEDFPFGAHSYGIYRQDEESRLPFMYSFPDQSWLEMDSVSFDWDYDTLLFNQLSKIELAEINKQSADALRESMEVLRKEQAELRNRLRDIKREERRVYSESRAKAYRDRSAAQREIYELRRRTRSNFKSQLEGQLRQDGLMKENGSYSFKLKKGTISVNGKKLRGTQYDTYKALVNSYFDDDGNLHLEYRRKTE